MAKDYEKLREKLGITKNIISLDNTFQSSALNFLSNIKDKINLNKTVITSLRGKRNFASTKTSLYQQSFHKSLFKSEKTMVGLNQ